ncbi:MAG: hypothetical protein HYS22_00515 [Deltaproteobacteria bacterium]|nr:hypothetical protein [Deltaproteobacteria bacterium]
MKIYSKKFVWLALLSSATLYNSCGGNGTTASTGISFKTAANFSASASASLSKFLAKVATTTKTCAELKTELGAAITQDDPSLADGLDCDGDLGVVAHVTPTKYSLAFKKVVLKAQTGGTDINLIADTGTLAKSEVVEFTSTDSSKSVITIAPGDLTAGTYTEIEAELYYFQMTFPVAGVTQNVRIYMSDDDFAAEAADRIGLGGHHQGDVTLVGDDGVEEGWIDYTWTTANLMKTRPTVMGGAATSDPETTHDRGFFGDNSFWNTATLTQGANQDIYIATYDFDTGKELVIPDPTTITNLTTVTVTFSTADTFFYEDFAPFGSNASFPGFYPDTGGEATAAGEAWAPLAPTATVTYN